MLHRDDIEADLARGDPEDLRDAFDALVTWHGASTIAGVTSAEELMALFARVCAAMLGDDGQLPQNTAQALLRGRGAMVPCVGPGPASDAVTTYDGAARFALTARRTWWPAFSATLPSGT